MPPKLPDPHELAGLLTNVLFEVEVLAWSLHRAAALEHDAEVARIYQAAVDRSSYVNAALVAARNLYYFFDNSRWRKGAPAAEDFVPTWVPMSGGPVLDAVNHQVVHIGLSRVRDPQHVDLGLVAADIDHRLGLFFAQIDPSVRNRAHLSLAEALQAVTTPGKHR